MIEYEKKKVESGVQLLSLMANINAAIADILYIPCFKSNQYSETVAEWKCLWSSIRYGPLKPPALNPLIQKMIMIIIINSCTFEELKCCVELNEWRPHFKLPLQKFLPMIFLEGFSCSSYVQLRPVLFYLVTIMRADWGPWPCFIPGLIVVWIFQFWSKDSLFLQD